MAINDLTYQDQWVFSSPESFKDWVSTQNRADQETLETLFPGKEYPLSVTDYYNTLERYGRINGLDDPRFQRPENWMDGIVGTYSTKPNYYLEKHGMALKAEPCKPDPFIGPKEKPTYLAAESQNVPAQEVAVVAEQEKITPRVALARTQDTISGMLTRAADFTTKYLLSPIEVNGRQYLGLGLGLMAGFLQDTLIGGGQYALVRAMIQSATGLVGDELKAETNKVVSSLNKLFTDIFGGNFAFTAPFQKLSHDIRQDKYLQGQSSNPYFSIADETLDFMAGYVLTDDSVPDLDQAMGFLSGLVEKTTELRDQQLEYAEDISEAHDPIRLASLLAPFEQSVEARKRIYAEIGVDPALVDNALAQMEEPTFAVDNMTGTGMMSVPGYTRTDLQKPEGVSEENWATACVIARGKAIHAYSKEALSKLLIVGNVALVAATVFCPPAGAALNWARLGIMAAGGLMSAGASAIDYREAAQNLRQTTSLQTAGKMTNQDWMPEGLVEVANEGKTYVTDKALLSMALMFVPGAKTIGRAMIRGGTDAGLLTLAGPEGNQDYQNKKAELAGTQAPEVISGLIFSVTLGAVIGGVTHAAVASGQKPKLSSSQEPVTPTTQARVLLLNHHDGEAQAYVIINGKRIQADIKPVENGIVELTYTVNGQKLTQRAQVNGTPSVVRPQPEPPRQQTSQPPQGQTSPSSFTRPQGANQNPTHPVASEAALQGTGTDGPVSPTRPQPELVVNNTPDPNAPRASTPNGNDGGNGNQGGSGGQRGLSPSSASGNGNGNRGAAGSGPTSRQSRPGEAQPLSGSDLTAARQEHYSYWIDRARPVTPDSANQTTVLAQGQYPTTGQNAPVIIRRNPVGTHNLEGPATTYKSDGTRIPPDPTRPTRLQDGDLIEIDQRNQTRYYRFNEPDESGFEPYTEEPQTGFLPVRGRGQVRQPERPFQPVSSSDGPPTGSIAMPAPRAPQQGLRPEDRTTQVEDHPIQVHDVEDAGNELPGVRTRTPRRSPRYVSPRRNHAEPPQQAARPWTKDDYATYYRTNASQADSIHVGGPGYSLELAPAANVNDGRSVRIERGRDGGTFLFGTARIVRPSGEDFVTGPTLGRALMDGDLIIIYHPDGTNTVRRFSSTPPSSRGAPGLTRPNSDVEIRIRPDSRPQTDRDMPITENAVRALFGANKELTTSGTGYHVAQGQVHLVQEIELNPRDMTNLQQIQTWCERIAQQMGYAGYRLTGPNGYMFEWHDPNYASFAERHGF